MSRRDWFGPRVLVACLLVASGCFAPGCSKRSEPAEQANVGAPSQASRTFEDGASARLPEDGTGEPRFVPGPPPEPEPPETGYVGDGIYLLPGEPDALVLVLSDGDGEHDPVRLLEPVENTTNQWQFQQPGNRLERSDPRLAMLRTLPHEGFYRITRELRFATDGRWITNAIVQLGYTKQAEPIVFIAQRRPDESTLFFSEKGVKIRRDQLKWLELLAWYEEPPPE